MSLVPDLAALRMAADKVDRTAEGVEVGAADTTRLVEDLPWRGPRRELVAASVRVAAGVARQQAAAERDLARALRQLALEVEHELQVLRELASRARQHLEELLQQAHALVASTADAVASVAAGLDQVLLDVVTGHPADALRDARRLADTAVDRLRRITDRLGSRPEPHDPVWRTLCPQILCWHP